MNLEKLKGFIILDTETTGCNYEVNTEEVPYDEIIQFSYEVLDREFTKISEFNKYYKPRNVEISPMIMSLTNITPEDVSNSPYFNEDTALTDFFELVMQGYVPVGHNVRFDLSMLATYNDKIRKIIENNYLLDTLKLAKHNHPEYESHNLRYCYYATGVYRSQSNKLSFHNSQADVVACREVFKYFVNEVNDLEKVHQLSITPVLLKTFNFGKHNGELISDVVAKDPGYISWYLRTTLEDQSDNNMRLNEDMLYSVNYYKERNEKW